jgi:hypothetical protein
LEWDGGFNWAADPPVLLHHGAVSFDVGLCGLFGMVLRVDVVTVREVSMMAGFYVFTGLVMLRRFSMVTGCVLVMFGSLVVMLSNVFRHKKPPHET